MRNALVRTILIVLALCVGAWLALGYRAIQLDRKGEDAVASFRDGPIPPARAREALDALDDARFLNADEAPNLIEGNLRLWMGERDRAAAIARQITDREPQNASAWFLAYLAETGPAKRAAIRRISELDPWAGEVLR